MDDSPMTTITSLAILGLVVIFIVVFACHYLGPHAASWMRSNKEEKIGLSKNKLFHANGYLIHSGSEFLLSTSGSFKRFDSVDPDFRQTGQHSTAQVTSPLWSLPQTDQRIPPQPLRPAPAPLNSAPFGTKTVTFSFSPQPEHLCAGQVSSTANPLSVGKTHENYVPCMRTLKQTPIPLAIQAPPPPQLTAPSTALLSTSAVPRPVVRRQQASVSNWKSLPHPNASTHHITLAENHINQSQHPTSWTLSTNPFHFQSENGLTREEQSNTATPTAKHAEVILPHPLSSPNDSVEVKTSYLQTTNKKNPFYSETTEVNPSQSMQVSPTSTENPAVSHNEDIPNNHNDESPLSECPKSPEHSTKSTVPVPQNQLFRNRSFSETEASDPNLTNFSSKMSALGLKISGSNNPFTTLTQKVKVKGPHMLQKTLSEDFLLRNKTVASSSVHGNTTWSFGRSFLRQDSQSSIWRQNSSQTSLGSSMDSINLERAISCDSVNSESSIVLSDLEQPFTQITGYLCVDIQYNKNSITQEGLELIVSVIGAKEIVCPLKVDSFDTFVRIYLVPDQAGAMQTKVVNSTLSPSYNESFTFWLKKQQGRHSLWFHLYHNGRVHTLLGEAEMEISEMPRPGTTWILLSDLRKSNAKWGELMFSLSYLPTAERLTVVVVKARNVNLNVPSGPISTEVLTIFVKIYLMNHDKKVLKKRTSHKRKDRCPIFNESVIFSLPPQSLSTVQLRLTVFGVLENASVAALGHVIVGSCATGKGLRHWHQMLSSLRKPVAMWHILRRAANQPIFTGGTEAVMAAMQSSALRTKRNSIF